MNNPHAAADARTDADAAVLHDRRRPGRKDVDPSLIPLLRGQVCLEDVANDPVSARPAAPEPTASVRDDLAPVIGIMRGLGVVGIAGIGLALLILF